MHPRIPSQPMPPKHATRHLATPLRKTLFFFLCCALLLLPLLALTGRLAPAAQADPTQCQQQSVPVTLSPLDPTTYHVATWLCWQGTLTGKTVQLLVHGYTYDHLYWDLPYQSPNYSYVTAAVQAGYATLNIDRLGVGLSDHPAPELLTTISDAYVLHELVQDLRGGTFQGMHAPKVMLVCPSIQLVYAPLMLTASVWPTRAVLGHS